MFEFSVARKYLTPRWRQLSVSIISLISIAVIALVVWLIVVFFSVTAGLEKTWIQKLISLTAPIRVTPTEHYYESYYYKVDSISAASDYLTKSIGEKLKTEGSNPHNLDIDEEIPTQWPKPDLDNQGNLIDPVKSAYQIFNDIPALQVSEFEMTMAPMRLRLIRELEPGRHNQAFLNQNAYIGSLDSSNTDLWRTVRPLSMEDLTHLFKSLPYISPAEDADEGSYISSIEPAALHALLKNFFTFVQLKSLRAPETGIKLPRSLLPASAVFSCICEYRHNKLYRIWLPIDKASATQKLQSLTEAGAVAKQDTLTIENNDYRLSKEDVSPLTPLYTAHLIFQAEPDLDFLAPIQHPKQLRVTVKTSLQGVPIEGKMPFGDLYFHEATIQNKLSDIEELSQLPLWLYQANKELHLPQHDGLGNAVLLPRKFKDTGVQIGDKGYLSYQLPTLSAMQEEKIPIFVVGFYDPGIIPIGGKFVITDAAIANAIRSAHSIEENYQDNGFNLRFADLNQASKIKEQLTRRFEAAGILPYWKIETFRDYEFTKDIIQQLQSDKGLFMIIATVIIIVACSNIVSMLIILVNDKKLEIGILRSMGASSFSIATIFGFCGVVMGITGSVIGAAAAALTLQNLNGLVSILSFFQGREAFNPNFYGDKLPNEMSGEAILFVILATGCISLIAGIVPAVKACLLKPSSVLKSE